MASTVQLQSSDQQIFKVEMEVASMSDNLKTVITDLCLKETDEIRTIPLPTIDGTVLEMILIWCRQHKNDPLLSIDKNDITHLILPEWDREFFSRLDERRLVDLTNASVYLQINLLVAYCCQIFANALEAEYAQKGMYNDWIIPNDFSLEKEAEIRRDGPRMPDY